MESKEETEREKEQKGREGKIKKAVGEKKLNRIDVNVEEKRMVGDDRKWVKRSECDGGRKGKGMHEQDGFLAGESNTGAFAKHKLCKDIKIGLCVSNISGFGSEPIVELMQIIKFDIASIKAVVCLTYSDPDPAALAAGQLQNKV